MSWHGHTFRPGCRLWGDSPHKGPVLQRFVVSLVVSLEKLLEAVTVIWGVLWQKQISRAGTSNYIPQYLWDVITCPGPWYLLLPQLTQYIPRIMHTDRSSWYYIREVDFYQYTPRLIQWHRDYLIASVAPMEGMGKSVHRIDWEIIMLPQPKHIKTICMQCIYYLNEYIAGCVIADEYIQDLLIHHESVDWHCHCDCWAYP